MSRAFSIEHRGDAYAVDVVAALAITRVTEAGDGYDAAWSDLPGDLRERLADQILADWAADCCTVPTAAERHLVRHVVRALLPDPNGDEQDETALDDVLRAKWTQGRAAA